MNITNLRNRLAEFSQVENVYVADDGYIRATIKGEECFIGGNKEDECFLNILCQMTESFKYSEMPYRNSREPIKFFDEFLSHRKFKCTEVAYVNDDRKGNLFMAVGQTPYRHDIIHEFKNTGSRKERCLILIEFIKKVIEWEKNNL